MYFLQNNVTVISSKHNSSTGYRQETDLIILHADLGKHHNLKKLPDLTYVLRPRNAVIWQIQEFT